MISNKMINLSIEIIILDIKYWRSHVMQMARSSIHTEEVAGADKEKKLISGEEQERKIMGYEEAMHKIKEATGVSDIQVHLMWTLEPLDAS